MNAVATLWKNHGTKILGSFTAVIAALLTFTPDQMQSIFGATAPRVTLALTGIATVLRGVSNSNKGP